jgi:hypothetical protein
VRSTKRLVINGQTERRYWREVATGSGAEGDESGDWRSDAQPDPGPVVIVNHRGIQIRGLKPTMRPFETRALASRLAEAAGIYESAFGGDGSMQRRGERPVDP